MRYIYAYEPDETFRFFKMPKSLFSERYEGVSFGAKLLYGFMLDRAALSKQSENWVDPDGRVFIYFSIQEIMKLFHIADNRATKLCRELENAGLIERKRQSLGRPAKIYVGKCIEEQVSQ